MLTIRIIPRPIPPAVIRIAAVEPVKAATPGCCPTCKRKLPKPRKVIDPHEKRIAKVKAAINAGLRKPMPKQTKYKE